MKSNKQIMIIDDEFHIRELLKFLLETSRHPCSIKEFYSYEHALDKFGDIKYDIVFCGESTHGISTETVIARMKISNVFPNQFWVIGSLEDKHHPHISGIIDRTNFDSMIHQVNRIMMEW